VDHALRRSRLAARLPDLGVDAVFVTRLPNVRYLTGFTGSNGQLLLGAEGAAFFTDGRYEEQARREVPDLDRVVYLDGVPPLRERAGALGIDRLAFEAEGTTYRGWEQLGERLEGVELVPAGAEVERLRRIKDADEVDRIAHAQEAADAAFERVVLGGWLREERTERELALELELAMRRSGADDKGFSTIAAFGENAAEPHHEPTDRALARGDVVKLDFGGMVDGYRSDMTRTVAFGEPGGRLRELRDLVAAAQRAGIGAVRPGASVAEVDRAARSVIEEAGLAEAFPHGLGHGVGLEIHEEPRLRWDGTDVVPEGAVVTIEPGVYIQDLGGVRIEDMVEVTADGCRPIPRSTKELVVL
jgi:Xaa-Pro aminopeptidase